MLVSSDQGQFLALTKRTPAQSCPKTCQNVATDPKHLFGRTITNQNKTLHNIPPDIPGILPWKSVNRSLFTKEGGQRQSTAVPVGCYHNITIREGKVREKDKNFTQTKSSLAGFIVWTALE